MELKYGMSSTYKYELDKERLEWLVKIANRSKGQTQFLFNLVNGNFDMLLKLESQIKNCHIFYCPGDLEELNYIMSLTPKNITYVFKYE